MVLNRLLPKSLSGQLIGLILLTLLGSHIIAVVILADERREALEAATRGEVLARTATIARLLSISPTNLHDQILENAQSPFVQFSLTASSATKNQPRSKREHFVASRIRDMLETQDVPVHVRLGVGRQNFEDDDDDHDKQHDNPRQAGRDDGKSKFGGLFKHHKDGKRWRRHFRWGIQLSVQLTNGKWLNSATRSPLRKSSWTLQPLLALGISIILIVGAVLLTVRRITRPLATLASAADAVGRGETTSDITEKGPEDLKQTIRAFNRMRNRLETFVEDRTNLIAAVSHDLRSPVTSLRLRAEFIEDLELRAAILDTLSEMQTLIETTLIFAREETRTEDTRPTDLAALIESISDDFQDQGKPCTYSGPDRLVLSGRPVSLKRAFRNLMDNALTYGNSATVTLVAGDTESGSDHTILVEDTGPGIPDKDIEQMFQPFVRFETSRNKETGGIGLGLANSRSIIRGHGGDILAQNKPEGGLIITVHLPQADTD